MKIGNTKTGGAFENYKKCIIKKFSILKKGEFMSTTLTQGVLHDVKTGKDGTQIKWMVSLCLVALLCIIGLRNYQKVL